VTSAASHHVLKQAIQVGARSAPKKLRSTLPHRSSSTPLPSKYRQRQPQQTVLHEIVRKHLQTMLAQASLRSESGGGCPRFVEHEFRRYLNRISRTPHHVVDC
jgi:hypothetical protein